MLPMMYKTLINQNQTLKLFLTVHPFHALKTLAMPIFKLIQRTLLTCLIEALFFKRTGARLSLIRNFGLGQKKTYEMQLIGQYVS